MRRIVFAWAVAVAVFAAAAGLRSGGEAPAAAGQNAPVIRFHVIANSDSPADQALKLKVRDQVIQAMGPVLAGAGNVKEAGEKVDSNLGLIQATAEKAISENGFSYPVKVVHGNFQFPEKTYRINSGPDGGAGELTLPAGDYQAVRVIIGSGRGANWWCVLFPPLCFVSPDLGPPTAGREVKEKLPDEIPAFRQDHIEPEKAGAAPAVQYSLKVVEWYRQARDWGRGIGD